MSCSANEVAGVVILYNSSMAVVDNILTYCTHIDRLYAIDNSEQPNPALISRLRAIPNLTYKSNGGNLGIGSALNKAANMAIETGYRYLLTMDDDSSASPNMVESMLSFVATQPPQQLGIVSVNHSGKPSSQSFVEVLYTMTSGNLLILDAFAQVGPFNEQLFIDHVDHDYCLRLNRRKYKVIELPSVLLNHRLGSEQKIRLLGLVFSYVSHSPLRIYYMVRNGIYVAGQYASVYPAFRWTVLKLISKEVIKIIFWDTHKVLRFRYVIQGVNDAYRGKLGPFQ